MEEMTIKEIRQLLGEVLLGHLEKNPKTLQRIASVCNIAIEALQPKSSPNDTEIMLKAVKSIEDLQKLHLTIYPPKQVHTWQSDGTVNGTMHWCHLCGKEATTAFCSEKCYAEHLGLKGKK
jgi:hypothetical protein